MTWMLGIELHPLEEKYTLLTTEALLQPIADFLILFMINFLYPHIKS